MKSTNIEKIVEEISLSIVKGTKVLLVYILPTTIAVVLTSPEFRDFVADHPSLIMYGPLINLVAIVVGNLMKGRFPENKTIHKIL